MKNRGSVVLIEDEKVVLIRRVMNGETYYVFPGGGIENAETPEQAAKREALEELGVDVEIKECLLNVDFNGTQFFFLSNITSGTIGTGTGEEYTDQKRDRGTYTPMWVALNRLPSLDVRPEEVSLTIQSRFLKPANR